MTISVKYSDGYCDYLPTAYIRIVVIMIHAILFCEEYCTRQTAQCRLQRPTTREDVSTMSSVHDISTVDKR